MSKKIDNAIREDLTTLKACGISLLDIPLGDLISLLSTKGKQYHWLMDVLEHPKKRAQILREYRRRNARAVIIW